MAGRPPWPRHEGVVKPIESDLMKKAEEIAKASAPGIRPVYRVFTRGHFSDVLRPRALSRVVVRAEAGVPEANIGTVSSAHSQYGAAVRNTYDLKVIVTKPGARRSAELARDYDVNGGNGGLRLALIRELGEHVCLHVLSEPDVARLDMPYGVTLIGDEPDTAWTLSQTTHGIASPQIARPQVETTMFAETDPAQVAARLRQFDAALEAAQPVHTVDDLAFMRV